MAYSDFTMDSVSKSFGIKPRQATLFPPLNPLPVPSWLQEMLVRGFELALLSEKARSELFVMPILLAARELSQKHFAIYSGQRLDVDPERGLVGECDFILTLSPSVPMLMAPIAIIVEAKKQDIEGGIGQCVAQLLGARQFNQQDGTPRDILYGCVTTGELWQFLRLVGSVVEIDTHRYYIEQVGILLSILQLVTEDHSGAAPSGK